MSNRRTGKELSCSKAEARQMTGYTKPLAVEE